jgi:hypothetical protein
MVIMNHLNLMRTFTWPIVAILIVSSLIHPPVSGLTQVASLQLNAVNGFLDVASSVIDLTHGYAYFGSAHSSPTKVAKVRLSDFSEVDSIALAGPGWSQGWHSEAAVIDEAAGYAYFGTDDGHIVKIALASFTIAEILLPPNVAGLSSAVIDTANGFAYFGEESAGGGSCSYSPCSPGVIVKVRLSDFTVAGTLTLNQGEDSPGSAVLDSVNGFAYFGTSTTCTSGSLTYSCGGRIVKIRLSDFSRVTALVLDSGEDVPNSALIDLPNGFAYFVAYHGTTGVDFRIDKVRLADLTEVATLPLEDTVEKWAGVIDAANGYAYFGTTGGSVDMIRLSDFNEVGTIILNANADISSGVIDTTNGFAYFGTLSNGFPTTIYKVDVHVGTNAGFDFSVATSGAINLLQGGSGGNTITVLLVTGVAQAVSLSCGGLPADASCTFASRAGLPSFTTSLSVGTKSTTPAGVYTVTVNAFGNGLLHQTAFQLSVTTVLASTGTVSNLVQVNPSTLPPPPNAVTFPDGLFSFRLGGLILGQSVTVSITAPPSGSQYWKYGPTPDNHASHWYQLPAVFSANTATITIVDGGLGDDDLSANGVIVDTGGPAAGSSADGFVSGTYLVSLPVSGGQSSGPTGDQSSASTTFTPSAESVSVTSDGSKQYLLLATSQLWDSKASVGASMAVCRDGVIISGDMFSLGATANHRHLGTAMALDTPSTGSHTYALCYKTDPGGIGFVSSTFLIAVPVSGGFASGPTGDQSTTSTTFTNSAQAIAINQVGSQQYLVLATSQLWDNLANVGASVAVCRDGARISGDMYTVGATLGHRHLATAVSLDTPTPGQHTYSLCYKTDPGGIGFVSGTLLILVPVGGAVQSGPGGDQSTSSISFLSSLQNLPVTASGSQQYVAIATSQLWDTYASTGASMAVCMDGSRISGDMYSAGPISTHRHLATAIALSTPSSGGHTYSLCYKTDPGNAPSSPNLSLTNTISTQILAETLPLTYSGVNDKLSDSAE